MYTQCTQCGTVFRVNGQQLKMAQGQVRCGECATVFNALESLVDEWPDLAAGQGGPATAAPEPVEDDSPSMWQLKGLTALGRKLFPGDDEDTESSADEAEQTLGGHYDDVGWVPDEEATREFQVPEAGWDQYLKEEQARRSAEALHSETANTEEWQHLLEEDAAEAAGPVVVIDEDEKTDDAYGAYARNFERDEPTPGDDVREDEPAPVFEISDAGPGVFGAAAIEAEAEAAPWQPGSRAARAARELLQRRHTRSIAAAAALLLLLATQLVHYNRDALAAHPRWGATVRSLYAGLGGELYPRWNLSDYAVRGSEAIAGRGAPEALDIHARVAIESDQPIGLPMIRVVLRDRWSNPVGSRVFAPGEYLPGDTPAPGLLDPGDSFPVHVVVMDPGMDAHGYEVDVCLPDRSQGLKCQLDADPWRS